MKFGIGIPSSHQGVYLPNPFAGPDEITEVTQVAERLGFYSGWVLDFMTPTESRLKAGRDGDMEWHEAMVSLSYLAAATSSIRLGAATVVLPHRDPVILAKQAATLDVFSGGRLLLGIGLGSSRDEFEMVRPRDTGVHRGRLLLESLEAMHLLFTQDNVTFEGEYVAFRNLSFHPKPVQDPFAFYISGKTPDTPRRVAKWGTGWLLSRADPRTVQERVDSLHPHLEEAGRKRSNIDIVVTKGLSMAKTREEALKRFQNSMLPGRMDTMAAQMGFGGRPSQDRVYQQNLIGTPDDIREQLGRVREEGVDHCVVFYFAVHEYQEMLEQLQWFGEDILPGFASV